MFFEPDERAHWSVIRAGVLSSAARIERNPPSRWAGFDADARRPSSVDKTLVRFKFA
jgi:hypothetical protein